MANAIRRSPALIEAALLSFVRGRAYRPDLRERVLAAEGSLSGGRSAVWRQRLLCFLLGSNIGFVAVHRLAPLVADPLGFGIMLDAGQRKQRRIYQRAGVDYHATGIKLTRDCLEQHPVQIQADQDAPEAHEGGALRRGLVCSKAADPTKAGPIIQRLGQA